MVNVILNRIFLGLLISCIITATTYPYDISELTPNDSTESIHGWMEFDHPPTLAIRKQLETAGIKCLQYKPPARYYIQAKGDDLIALSDRNDLNIQFVPISTNEKLKHLVDINSNPKAKSSAKKASISKYEAVKVIFQRGTPYKKAVTILSRYNAHIDYNHNGYDYHETFASIRVPSENLSDLADENSVFLVTYPDFPYQSCNVNAADSSNVNEIQSGVGTGYNLDGSGVTLGIWDAGAVRTNHEQLQNRATQMDNNHSPNRHATHVAGTMVASGAGNANAKGMAPAAELLCFDQTDDIFELEQHAHLITASNHSYRTSVGWEYDETKDQWRWYGQLEPQATESFLFGKYNARSHAWDRLVHDQNLIIVTAAGNDRNGTSPPPNTPYYLNDSDKISHTFRPANGQIDNGYDTITTLGTTKNLITVGSVNDLTREPPKPSDDSMTTYSSWGPTDDGRIKPDIVTNGTSLLSLSADADNAYLGMGGTSSAAPVVTGTIALLTQLYRQRFGGADPDAAIMKSLLLHTAIDGGSKKGPDYEFGWGLMNARKAADFIQLLGNLGKHIEFDTYKGEAIEIPLSYAGFGPIKATLVWIDPPGFPTSNGVDDPQPILVNDLDLSIDGPDRKHYPWTLDPSSPNQPATQNRENHRDNVEQVYIENPQDGNYTLRIDGKINLGQSQQVALCLTGLNYNMNRPRLSILHPTNRRVIQDTIPIIIQSGSTRGISQLIYTIDGSAIPNTQSDFFFFPPKVDYTHSLTLNTNHLSNGNHTFEIEAISSNGESSHKQITLQVFNESTGTPTLYKDDKPRAGRIWPSNDMDWYQFEVEENGEYIIETHPFPGYEYLDTTIQLFGPNNRQTLINQDDDSGELSFSKVVQQLRDGRTYHILVDSQSYTTGLYSISLTKNEEDQTSIPQWYQY